MLCECTGPSRVAFLTHYFSRTLRAAENIILSLTAASASPCNLEAPVDGFFASSSAPCVVGGLAQTPDSFYMTTSLNELCSSSASIFCSANGLSLSQPEGIASGGAYLWVANAGNASVTAVAPANLNSQGSYLHDSANGGTMTAPYGIAIAEGGNIWVSNAGCVDTTGNGCTPGPFVLSELLGATRPTLAPLAAQTSTGNFGGVPENPSSRSAHPAARRLP